MGSFACLVLMVLWRRRSGHLDARMWLWPQLALDRICNKHAGMHLAPGQNIRSSSPEGELALSPRKRQSSGLPAINRALRVVTCA